MGARVRVTRVMSELGWIVQCDRCPSGTASLFAGLFGGVVVRAHAFEDAVWWATWHAHAHDASRCHSCARDREVEAVTVLDENTVKVGKRWFHRVPYGWQEVAA